MNLNSKKFDFLKKKSKKVRAYSILIQAACFVMVAEQEFSCKINGE